MGWRPRPPPPDQASRPWQLVWSRAQWQCGHWAPGDSVVSAGTRNLRNHEAAGVQLMWRRRTQIETHVICLSKEIIVILMPYKLHIRMTRCQCAKSTTVMLIQYVMKLCALWGCLIMKQTWYRSISAVFTTHTLNPSQQVVVVKVLPPLRLVW